MHRPAGPAMMMSREELVELPPGFRFHPTDEEIITNYLIEKFLDRNFNPRAIGEVDLNKCEPWDLPGKAKNIGEKEWYYFCQRDRKYPTGTRTNRATEAGYWKATGKDKEIFDGNGNLVGMKKTLVFYRGRAPRGEKTNWVIHEFRLEGNSYCHLPRADRVYDEWVVCRVTHKNTDEMTRTNLSSASASTSTSASPSSSSMTSYLGSAFLDTSTLPPLMDSSYLNAATTFINASGGDHLIIGSSSAVPMLSHQSTLNNYPYLNPQYLPPNPMNSTGYSHQSRNVAIGGCFVDPNQITQMRGQGTSATQGGGSETASGMCKEEQCSNQSLVTSSSTAISNDRSQLPAEMGNERSSLDELDELLSSAGSLGDIESFWKC